VIEILINHFLFGDVMALGPKEIAELLKMRALGYSQAEIAEKLKTTQQNIAYHLKKLREKAEKNGTDEAFNAALIGGLVGATTGIATFALLELLKNQKE
jgi:DNA-binding CsgD family transcriptional regulator